MKKNNILYLVLAFALFITDAILSSKRIKFEGSEIGQEKEKVEPHDMPLEILEHIVGYVEPETALSLTETNVELKQLSVPVLLNKLVRYNISIDNFNIPSITEYYFEREKGKRAPKEIRAVVNRLLVLYTTSSTEEVTFKDKQFRDDYKAAIFRNITFFLNSKSFFDIITEKVTDYVPMEARKRRLLRENFGIFFDLEKVEDNNNTVKIVVETRDIQTKELKQSLTFLVTDTVESANNLLPQYSTQNITKVVLRSPWIFPKNPLAMLNNLQTHFMPIVDRNNRSLLSAACILKYTPFVSFCLDKNVSWHADVFGNNPIHYTVFFDVGITRDKKSVYYKVFQFAGVGNLNPRFRSVSIDGLILGAYETIQTLLSRQILLFHKNVNRKNNNGVTPLSIIIRQARLLNIIPSNNFIYLFDILLQNGADPNQFEVDSGDTLLSHVCKTITDLDYEKYLVTKLLEHKANPNMENKESEIVFKYDFIGDTPLDLMIIGICYHIKNFNDANYQKMYDLIKLLLEKGADPNRLSKEAETSSPLIFVMQNAQSDAIRFSLTRLLLAFGADPYKKSYYEYEKDPISPFEYAEKNNFTKILALFENREVIIAERLENVPEETPKEKTE